jgi:hypothetical protein
MSWRILPGSVDGPIYLLLIEVRVYSHESSYRSNRIDTSGQYMSLTKREYGEHFSRKGSKQFPDIYFRQLVALVGLLSLCFLSVLYGLTQTRGNNQKLSPRKAYKVGDDFENVLKIMGSDPVTLMLVMGQAVYDLGTENEAIVVVPKKIELLRSKKKLRLRNLPAIKHLSGRGPIVIDYDPRLDDKRIKRFSRSPGLRKYPQNVFVLREPGAESVKRWAFISDKKRRRIFLVPLSMVPKAK